MYCSVYFLSILLFKELRRKKNRNETNLLMATVVFYDLIIIRVCTKFMVYNNCLIVKSTIFFTKVKVHVNIPIFGFDPLVIGGPGIVVVNFLKM